MTKKIRILTLGIITYTEILRKNKFNLKFKKNMKTVFTYSIPFLSNEMIF